MSAIAALDQAFRDICGDGRVAGLVAMAASGSQLIYQGAFGQRETGAPAPMTPDSVFWVASMTKAVTTFAALQLVERGRLSLDAPAGDWVPELANPQVLEGFDSFGTPLLRSATSPITLRQLLTHTSGLTYDMWDGNQKLWLANTGTPGIGSGRLGALRTVLASDPGARWAYGTGIDYAGRVVEAASGMRLETYFHGEIFAPLEMHDTGFVLSPHQRPRLAVMHRRQPDGSLLAIPFELNQSPEFFSGGGGLYSTAPDYIRFLQMILNRGRCKGRQLLQAETIGLMAQNQIGALEVQKMVSAMPQVSNDVEFWPGMAKKWSLGFLLNTEAVPEGRSAGSLAWGGLGNCYYWIDPARDVAGVILMQVLPFFDRHCLEAAWALEQAIYAG